MSWCTARWEMLLFCAKTIVKEPAEEEEVEEQRKTFWPSAWRLSGLVLSRCFLAPLGVFIVMKTLEDKR